MSIDKRPGPGEVAAIKHAAGTLIGHDGNMHEWLDKARMRDAVQAATGINMAGLIEPPLTDDGHKSSHSSSSRIHDTGTPVNLPNTTPRGTSRG